MKVSKWIIPAASLAAGAYLAVAGGQDAGFDLLNYHYYSGYSFLKKPFAYDFAPAQIQTFHNPLMHALSYLAFSGLPARGAAALLGAIQGLNFYLLFLIGNLLFEDIRNPLRSVVSFCCAAAGFYGIASVTEIGAAYGDNLISIPVLWALLLVLRALRSGQPVSGRAAASFAAAGLLVGAAFGLKFTSANYAIALALAAVPALRGTRNARLAAAALFGGLLVGFSASYGFWAVELYSRYGNPVFPYLNRFFQSPYFIPDNFLDSRFLPRTLEQAIFYPFYFLKKNTLVSEVVFRDIRPALCFLTVALISMAALVRLFSARMRNGSPGHDRKDPAFCFLLWFFVISYLCWLGISSIYRYLSVLELLAPAFIVLAVRRYAPKAVAGTAIALVPAVFLTAVPIDFGRQPFDDALLKAQLPRIPGLDDSLVLMTGYEPTAWVIPSFPATTRFVRISSTFSLPGRSPAVDREIMQTLSRYDNRHIFSYVPSAEEIGMARLDASKYGVAVDGRSCFELRSGNRNRGYLCGLAGSRIDSQEKPAAELLYKPSFVRTAAALLNVRAESRYITAQIAGVAWKRVDLLYEVDGELMPPLRNWPMDRDGVLKVGPFDRTGDYRILGIRDSEDRESDLWTAAEAQIKVAISMSRRPISCGSEPVAQKRGPSSAPYEY